MLVAVQKYVQDRKGGLQKAAGVVGALYLVRRYMRTQLEDVKERLEEENQARESLKRRFRQTQEDVSYTVLALLPTLAEQILKDMDVEALTRELKSRTGKGVVRRIEAPAAEVEGERPPSSLASSTVDVVSDADSDASWRHERRKSIQSTAISEASTSWVGVGDSAASSTSSQPSPAHDNDGSNMFASFVTTASLEPAQGSSSAAPAAVEPTPIPSTEAESSSPRPTESSVEPASVVSPYPETRSLASVDAESSYMSGSFLSASISAVSDGGQRTKTELWNEVKMLTLTRTLTTLYTTTLLSLLTTLQLTLLARTRYVSAVLAHEREERWREAAEIDLGVGVRGWAGVGGAVVRGLWGWGTGSGAGGGAGAGMEEVMMRMMMSGTVGGEWDPELAEFSLDGELRNEDGEGKEGEWNLSDEDEGKFLTMSWWLLHVGWKDVRERVRRAVEEVFEGVSLKTNIAAIDLHRLLSDVRRRVEHEITFEGRGRRADFLSSLLPPTPETIQHVLSQGGFSPDPYYAYLPSSSGPYPPTHSRNPNTYIDSNASLSMSSSPHSSPSPPGLLLSPSQAPAPAPPGGDKGFPALLTEARDILSSSDFVHVLEVCLDRGVEVLFEGLEANVFVPTAARAAEAAGGEGQGPARIRLAALLPGLARWSELALTGLPNELVDGILDVREVSALSAIVFGKFEECFK